MNELRDAMLPPIVARLRTVAVPMNPAADLRGCSDRLGGSASIVDSDTQAPISRYRSDLLTTESSGIRPRSSTETGLPPPASSPMVIRSVPPAQGITSGLRFRIEMASASV